MRFCWISVAVLVALVAAQEDLCFYPNGNWAVDNQAPCTTGGGNCCPLSWQCLSNGLCHNPAANLTGRYGCTDRSWQSQECTQICTNGNTAIGDESILQCDDSTYCCNGNGSLQCCDHKGDPGYHFFELPSGTVVASITSAQTSNPSLAPTTNSAATFTDGTPVPSLQTSSTTSRSTVLSTSTFISSSTPITSAPVSFSSSLVTSTGTDGRRYTTTEISRITITSSPSGGYQPGGPSAQTLGLAVGLPVGFVAIGALCLAFFFWRRHRQARATPDVRAYYADDDRHPLDRSPEMRHSYGHFPPEGRAPEADSFPVADTKSRKSELPGSVPGFGGVAAAPPTYSSPVDGRPDSEEKPELDSRQVIPAVNVGNPFELYGDSTPLESSPERKERSEDESPTRPLLAYRVVQLTEGDLSWKVPVWRTTIRRTVPKCQGENFYKNKATVDEIKKLAYQKQCTVTQIALAWVAYQGLNPIAGTTKPGRLEENWRSREVKLTDDEIAEMREIFVMAKPSGERFSEVHQSMVGH